MKQVICGWCYKPFMADQTKDRLDEYRILRCAHCGRQVNSSIKESTGNIVGRKHIHRDLKDGDVV